MDIETLLKEKIIKALETFDVSASFDDIVIEHSKSKEHGDYATNVAMKFARVLHKAPVQIAQDLIDCIDRSGLEKVEIAGPGFINFFISKDSLGNQVKLIIEAEDNYGKQEKKNKRINVEFVSANPTGNLHLGHARIAALGDSICRLYEAAGYDVTREFYVNDAGVQINHLGESIRARYLTLLGKETKVPSDGYLGSDIIDVAKKIIEKVGDKYLENDGEEAMEYFKREGMKIELEKIDKDLEMFRVKFDVYSSETDIRSNGAVEKMIEELGDNVYEFEGAKFLRTTAYLDDKDRAIVKSDGQYTYFTPDIVYHLNKLSRNYDLLIDILGADHHGYLNRMKSALMMKGYPSDILDFELVQVVRLMKGDVEIKMSKRTGNAVTLRELCEDCGIDAVRYFFVERSCTSHLDFDFDLAREQSASNPVYYAQYAHARLCKVLEKAEGIDYLDKDYSYSEKHETDLLKTVLEFPKMVDSASKERAPQKVTQYIYNLASLIHSFYTECRIIGEEENVMISRLALCKAAKITIKNALNLIGVTAPVSM